MHSQEWRAVSWWRKSPSITQQRRVIITWISLVPLPLEFKDFSHTVSWSSLQLCHEGRSRCYHSYFGDRKAEARFVELTHFMLMLISSGSSLLFDTTVINQLRLGTGDLLSGRGKSSFSMKNELAKV